MERINSPFENLMGMYIAEKGEGFCSIGIAWRKELTNPHGNFHGGVIASIVDTAAVQALRTLYPKGPYLTVNLEIRYKKASCDKEIFAQARARHLKGRFFQTEVKVLSKDSTLIAQASVKSFIPTYEEDRLKV